MVDGTPDYVLGRAEKDWESICTSLECTRDLLRKIDAVLKANAPWAITDARKLIKQALEITP